MEAGTFTTPELAPGEVFRIRVRIETWLCAVPDLPRHGLITATSSGDPTKVDAVGFIQHRIRPVHPVGPCGP
jgi:hypothetical protein